MALSHRALHPQLIKGTKGRIQDIEKPKGGSLNGLRIKARNSYRVANDHFPLRTTAKNNGKSTIGQDLTAPLPKDTDG